MSANYKMCLQISMVHAAEHALEHALVHSLGHAAAGLWAHAAGGALHGVIAGSLAANKTRKTRRREKVFGKTGGLSGFSRTKANKEVTETWSGAVAGTGGSISMGLMGAGVGQVN